MKSMNELYENIQKNIDIEYTNSKLIKKICSEFLTKGLDQKVANYLYSGNYEIEQLTKNELIAICKVLYENDYTIFKPYNYFSDSDLYNYEILIRENEEITDRIVLKNVIKCGSKDSFLAAYTNGKHVYEMVKNHNVRYNFESQRNPRIKAINETSIIKEININKKSTKEIKELFLSNQAPVSTIYFNLLTLPGKEPIINYDEDKKELTIVIDTDITSPHTLFCDVLDGWHRITGLMNAYEEALANGTEDELDAYLNIQIEMLDINTARNFISIIERKNKISDEYLAALKNDDYTKMARNISAIGNKDNNVFFNQIAQEYNEMKVRKMLTTIPIVSSALKESGASTNLFKQKFELNKLIEITTMIRDMITEYEFKGNKEQFYDSDFNKQYSWAVYINLAYRFINEDDYFLNLEKAIKVLIENRDKMNELKLGNKSGVSMKKIKEFVNIIVSEV